LAEQMYCFSLKARENIQTKRKSLKDLLLFFLPLY